MSILTVIVIVILIIVILPYLIRRSTNYIVDEPIYFLDKEGLYMKYDVQIIFSSSEEFANDSNNIGEVYKNQRSIFRRTIGKFDFHEIAISKSDTIKSIVTDFIMKYGSTESYEIESFQIKDLYIPDELYIALIDNGISVYGIKKMPAHNTSER